MGSEGGERVEAEKLSQLLHQSCAWSIHKVKQWAEN